MAVEKLTAREVADLDPYNIRENPFKEPPKPRKPRTKRTTQPKTQAEFKATPKSELKEQTRNLIKTFRQSVKDQAELWRLIPEIYLEQEGRTGFNDDSWMIVEERIWPFDHLAVDLRNGNIVYWDYQQKVKKLATDYAISNLNLGGLEELDALKTIGWLIKAAKRPYGTYYSKEEVARTEKNKEETRKNFGLKKPDYDHIQTTLQDYKQRKGIA